MIKLIQLNEDLEHLSDELKDKAVVALDDTQAQVALEVDERKDKVKKDTKPAIDATKELAKDTNADGEVREIFESINEDLDNAEDFSIASAITQLIQRGWENIDQVNSYLATFESVPEGLKSALDSIVEDNMIHIGLLQDSLKEVDPKAETLD